MRKAILSVALALMLLVVFAVPIFAATSDTVDVTATPSYISIEVTPSTYDIGGTGAKIAPATTYYACGLAGDESAPPGATVNDADCEFTITNTSTVATDITINFPHFISGDAMQNSGGGYTDAEAGEFGVSGYASGVSWPGGAVIFDNSGSGVFIDALGATTNIKFGWALKTQSDAWASGTAMTSTVVVSATIDA